jgi:hypothetical protein
MLTNAELIKRYGFDVENIEFSGIELMDTIAMRDTLEQNYSSLSKEEKRLLDLADKTLLDNAQSFYQEMNEFMNFSKADFSQPFSNWWAHIDKVVSGELIVDLDNHQVLLRNDNEQAATLTA